VTERPDFEPDPVPNLVRRVSRKPGCPTCDTDPDGKAMMPPHEASSKCESGKHTHCSCDTCF
jgi:hypothetical protein